MGWFGGRSDSVETVEGAQEVVSREEDIATKKAAEGSEIKSSAERDTLLISSA